MTPIERAARAVAEYTGQRLPPAGDVITCEGIARAVLQAIREPNRHMQEAFVRNAMDVKIGADFGWSDYAVQQWQAMIDAALSESS